MRFSPRRAAPHLAIIAAYALLAVVTTWPLVQHLDSHLFGDFLTDATQTARHIWWINHALTSGESVFYQPAFNYPDGLPGAWLWANPLEYFPGWLLLFAVSLNAATNLTLLFHLTLNGYAMHRLLYEITGRSRAVALFGGLLFAVYPAIQSRIYGGHAGVVALWALPLFLLLAYRARESIPRWQYLAGGVFLALSMAGNSTLLVYYTIPIAGSGLLYLLVTRHWAWFRRVFMMSTAGAAFGLLLLIPLALETATQPGYEPDFAGTVTYSADLLSVASPSFFHPVYESLDYPRRVLGTNLLEGTGYIGLVAGLLALLGLWRVPRLRPLALLALVVWLFSLGPLLKIGDTPAVFTVEDYLSYVPLPWGFFGSLPVLDISRTPGRFNLTLGLLVAIMAAFGARVLWERLRGRWLRIGVIAALSIAVFMDSRMFWPMPAREMHVPQAIHDLRERDDIRAVLNLPVRHRLRAKDALYMQAFHQQDIVAGQFVRDTPVSAAKLYLLESTLDPALLNAAGVDVILLFREIDPPGLALYDFALAQLGTPVYEDERIAVFDAPTATGEPGFTVAARPAEEDTQGWSLYAPSAGWTTLTAAIHSNADALVLRLDGTVIRTLTPEDAVPIPLYLPAAGYYEVSLETSPRCPVLISAATRCTGVTVTNAAFADFAPDTNPTFAVFTNGITLDDAFVQQDGDTLAVRLAWRFETAPADDFVRFVHVIAPDGTLVTQDDGPLPVTQDGSRWHEVVTLSLPDDIPPGAYRVVTGWYRFPSLARFPVASGGDAVEVGVIQGN